MTTKAARRAAARLAAVQALYQIDIGGGTPRQVIGEFTAHRRGAVAGDEGAVAFDADLFADLVAGAAESRVTLDRLIGETLAADWSLERLGATLRAVLRAAGYELTARTDIPPRVTIKEYVDIAHGFYAAEETGFVNGVLDRLARGLRADEMAVAATGPAPDRDGPDKR